MISSIKSIGKNHLIGSLVTGFVIVLLILAGPASALNLAIEGIQKDPYQKGENVNFVAKVMMNSNERLDMTNVSLEISRGNFKKICAFKLDGTPLEDCDGINISLVSNDFNFGYGYKHVDFNNESFDYGYGYGYAGAGEMVYNVTIEHDSLDPRNYDLWLIVNSPQREFKSDKYDFTISNGNNNDDNGNGGNGGGNGGGGGGGGFRHDSESLGDNSRDLAFSDFLNTREVDNPVEFDNLSFDSTESGAVEISPSFFSRITGAVIGTNGSAAFTGVVIFLALVFAALIYVRKRRAGFRFYLS